MSAQIWTILAVLKWSENFLREKNIASPKHDAEELLSFVLGYSRLDLYLHFDQPLTTAERGRYKELLLRRAKHEPLQYITGAAWFLSKKYKVTLHTLIPRYDTEILAETVLKYIDRAEVLIDLGTGSGILAIALAERCKKVYALDISSEALSVAAENARTHGVADKIEFIQSDLLAGLPEEAARSAGGVFLVSNPPYISPDEYAELEPEVRDYEPKTALWADDAGLTFYKKILAQAAVLGQNLRGVFFETGWRQARAVAELMQERFAVPAQIVKDLGGKERTVYTLLEEGKS